MIRWVVVILAALYLVAAVVLSFSYQYVLTYQIMLPAAFIFAIAHRSARTANA